MIGLIIPFSVTGGGIGVPWLGQPLVTLCTEPAFEL